MRSLLLVITFVAATLANPLQFRRPLHRSRIVGGEDAEPGQFPWQVSFQVDYFGVQHICGGSVLDETTVITAGHCCDAGFTATEMLIIAGEHNLSRDDGTEQSVGVSDVRLHENYDNWDLTNDICILKLAEALEIIPGTVEGVTLPEDKEETTGSLVVSGWGVEDESAPNLPDVLKWAEIPVVSDEECVSSYDDFIVQPVESMICAGESGRDHCFGDSGGPLVEAGTNKLIGIVSWADGCARPGRPGVNTQVSYFIDWITENAA